MNISCNDRERVFMDGTVEEWAALEAHAAGCAICAAEVREWKNLSVAASELHQEWDSAGLWPRIEEALAQNAKVTAGSRWIRIFREWNFGLLLWQTAAALLLIMLAGSGIWLVRSSHRDVIPQNEALLSDQTVNDVRRAELAYEKAIDKLDAQARPQLENSASPLMASYREKILVLDSAIADLKSQTGINPGNGHLRRELLAMYQEKQDTLEEVLEVKK
jgi:hypothetical protein